MSRDLTRDEWCKYRDELKAEIESLKSRLEVAEAQEDGLREALEKIFKIMDALEDTISWHREIWGIAKTALSVPAPQTSADHSEKRPRWELLWATLRTSAEIHHLRDTPINGKDLMDKMDELLAAEADKAPKTSKE